MNGIKDIVPAKNGASDKPFDMAYAPAVKVIKEAIQRSQARALHAVNSEVLSLNYGIGRYISENSRKGFWGTGALAHGAVVEAHNASDKIITADNGDRSRDSAVGDITVVLACDTASTAAAGYDGIVKGEVFHLSVDVTEKPLVIGVVVNTDTADGLVVAVEVAVERMGEDTNGRIIVFIGDTSVDISDVVHQLEELAAVVVAVVHVGGQRVQVGS